MSRRTLDGPSVGDIATPREWLVEALDLSHRCLRAAESADMEVLVDLDARRLQLLKSARLELRQVDAGSSAMLHEIARLNDRTIGAVEHHHRAKAREMDMAAAGRRALAAYSNQPLPR